MEMFVNFLDAIMGQCIYCVQGKFPNMPPPQIPPKPMPHDKFMVGDIHKLIGNFSCHHQSGPVPAMLSPPFHGRDHASVFVADLGLLNFGRCHHCCIRVKGAKQKETGFGCRSSMSVYADLVVMKNTTGRTISSRNCLEVPFCRNL